MAANAAGNATAAAMTATLRRTVWDRRISSPGVAVSVRFGVRIGCNRKRSRLPPASTKGSIRDLPDRRPTLKPQHL
ncbi:hypothetical protein Ahu01nite_053060 [Winogradskya humida]|uniref:Uncharacterized protein n=1 Tax=Winogradskya humida TaxID=113566 RepID=A0ABQ3ZUE8_9ACTN|nr:hypothetical protein Ahu01nite_053060 [Actinoplanes humidus]